MDCPRCYYATYHSTKPCPNCQFEGEAVVIDILSHIRWLLGEIETWPALNIETASAQILQNTYDLHRYQLEVTLGLRRPRFNDEEARQAWPDLIHREQLLQQIAEWRIAGRLHPQSTQALITQAQSQIDALLEQLESHSRPQYPQTYEDWLAQVDFLLQAAAYLSKNNGFVSLQSDIEVQAPLLAEKERLEVALGLRQPPEPEPLEEPVKSPIQTEETAPISQPIAPSRPVQPAVPLRERLWQSLLSERTLQALLFLGIFLLFSAAISFVVWGWRNFSAPLRVAIPCAFTTLFFGMGWYVRTKTPLYRSGVALSAIAALLIPIDFYTIYANFNIPTDYWPLFWLTTSLACLGSYVIVTLIIRSRLFSYLVVTAAGSSSLAFIEILHQTLGLSLDWRTAGLSVLAFVLIIIAHLLDNHRARRWRIFVEPFRYMALLAVGIMMPLTFGWRYLERYDYDALHYAVTINWWLGGLIFGWGAVRYRSRGLGILAAAALPMATYLGQAAIFHELGIDAVWQATGFALLVPLYLVSGHQLLAYRADPVIAGHSQTAARWGVALLIVAALWPLIDPSNGLAGAVSHTLLVASVILAALLWRRPTYLYGASLLSLSATMFVMTELNFTLAQLSVGWAGLAIGHIILALNLGTGFPLPIPNYARPVVVAGYSIAGLALVPPLFLYDSHLLVYALGNWLALTAWGARLAHTKQAGFRHPNIQRQSVFHWLTACPLPVWIWLFLDNFGTPDFSFSLALALLAWGMVLLSYRLRRINPIYQSPWYSVGLLVSIAAPIAAFSLTFGSYTSAVTLMMSGLLYFVDTLRSRQSSKFVPAGIVMAGGYLLLLDKFGLTFDAANFGLALLVSLYIGFGLSYEKQKADPATRQFLSPFYVTTHFLVLFILIRIYSRPVADLMVLISWTSEMRLWGAATQFILAVIYGLYTWKTNQERWGHAASWLMAASGGFLAITFSSGRGASAAEAATGAIVFVLAERLLHWLGDHPRLNSRQQTFIRFTWQLYQRPFLLTGWTVSAMTIGLALIRNFWLLGGGTTQQIWAAIGLLLITGLYALSAKLFKRVRFVWLAALLIFAPWTILTNLGWFTPYRPILPGFALSWACLAWGLFLSGLVVYRLAGRAYALPLTVMVHLLLPFSLLWGLSSIDTSRFTFALAIGLYGLAAYLDHRRRAKDLEPSWVLTRTKFLYPALGLIPVWCLYIMAWLLPTAQQEHYGLLLVVAFGPVGLIAGNWLKRAASQPTLRRGYALPSYLTGYGAMIIGTLLVTDELALLCLVLLFNILLLVVSAYWFKNSLWLYPAAIITPVSLLLALNEAGFPPNRSGWWLIGLATIYLGLAYLLRRAKLSIYSAAPLSVGLILILLSLPSSSWDQTGALWGYGSAVLLYGIVAFWLRQPLFLVLASLFVIVPYAIILDRWDIPQHLYGMALLPGAGGALAFGWWLDHHFGEWCDFPWVDPAKWPISLGKRLVSWWGLPFYTLGFGLATISPLFMDFQADWTALNFLLLIPIYGWAIHRFRLRVWLLATALVGHLAAGFYLEALGWWRYPAWAWLQFLPVTLITALVALFISRVRQEGSPLKPELMFQGWSRVLYIITLFDITIGQLSSIEGTWAAATVTLVHALLIAIFISVWLTNWLTYASLILGVISIIQWASLFDGPVEHLPVILSVLALLYGGSGYGLAFIRQNLDEQRHLRPWLAIWELPLQRFSLIFSITILGMISLYGFDLAGWTVRAMLGLSFRHLVDLATAQMFAGVLGTLGLLYLIAATAHRWIRLSYIGLAMLVISWSIQAFYIQQWSNLQWYAIPAGTYLLGIAYFEWERGNRVPARWLDYVAMTLLMGTLFWQTLLFGWSYALLLGAEGLATFWWGSARRLRRFLYVGMVGVMLATLGQLINSLWSINQWMVFGAVGLMLVLLAIVVERKLDDIKIWRETLEAWE